MIDNRKYTFFWKTESPFSNFYKCKFIVENIEFISSEQYFMYKKAMAFMDADTAEEILKSKMPWEAKKLGRQVKNFKKEEWDSMCERIMYDAVYNKFYQNAALLNILINTNDTKFVESSPVDSLWGIGLSEEDARKVPEEQWPGKNLLGIILTQLRYDLRTKIVQLSN